MVGSDDGLLWSDLRSDLDWCGLTLGGSDRLV